MDKLDEAIDGLLGPWHKISDQAVPSITEIADRRFGLSKQEAVNLLLDSDRTVEEGPTKHDQ